jgi:hypothetical protein
MREIADEFRPRRGSERAPGDVYPAFASCADGSHPVIPALQISHPQTSANVLLLGQTVDPSEQLLGCVLTRPSQNNPERVAVWEQRRRAVRQRIRTLRLERSPTQDSLALQSRLTRNVLTGVEHGRRSLLYERLFDITEALEVPVAALLAEDDSSAPASSRKCCFDPAQ